MARRRSRNTPTEEERDDPLEPVANLLAPIQPPAPLLTPEILSTPFDSLPDLGDLRDLEDRRTFHPDRALRPARNIAGRSLSMRTRLEPGPFKRIDLPRFDADPRQVLVCIRRKTRREVIFAKKKHRRGAGAKRRRRNYYSNVRC